MGLRDRLRRAERAAHGEMISIPQPGGGVARFPEKDLADAFIVALDRELGRSTEDHPLCKAARRSPDRKWRESVFGGPEEVTLRQVEDLSEP